MTNVTQPKTMYSSASQSVRNIVIISWAYCSHR